MIKQYFWAFTSCFKTKNNNLRYARTDTLIYYYDPNSVVNLRVNKTNVNVNCFYSGIWVAKNKKRESKFKNIS